MNNYYNRFKLVTKIFPWRYWIRWAYGQCIKDLKILNSNLDYKKKDFTCLLCGVSGEVTADEFIMLALSKNPHIKIKIIDYAEEQVNAVKVLVQNKYKDIDIE